MPADKLINQKDDYYIAMYSAHASIIENLIGEKGTIKKLLVDAGGLRAPKGSYKDKAIFDNYLPETKKTLHAKIIYLDQKKILSLWTGNLRKQTLRDQENIIVTHKIADKDGRKVKEWFDTPGQKGHLIICSSSNKTSEVYSSSNTIWDSFKKSLNKLKCGVGDELSLYAFSPWGSGQFVKNVTEVLKGKNLIKLSLYTRNESNENPIWIDTNIKNTNGLTIERYTKKSNTPFPHYKCVFITKKVGRKEKIIWGYIGSANLTKAAFFDNTNIEFAIFIDDIQSGVELECIFKKIRNSSSWEKRLTELKELSLMDESKEEFSNEDENIDNFRIRKHSNELCIELAKIKSQSELEKSYKMDKQYALQIGNNLYTISVLAANCGMFDLKIKCKDLSFSLSIKRTNDDEVHSDKDIECLLDDLFTISDFPGGGTKSIQVEQGTGVKKSFRNIRFPMDKFILNKELLSEKREILNKLKPELDRLSEDNKAMVKMWSQIIELWDK